MKPVVRYFSFLALVFLCCSNVSQPGVYNSGGMSFTMLFPEDSASYKKVQMKREKIHIQLYKGFAVVKGTYEMVNTSSQTLKFKMGYPVNGIYDGGQDKLVQVRLDSVYKFKVKLNAKTLAIDTSSHDDNAHVLAFNRKNWLIWQMDFAPHQTNFIEAYFIVNTNDGKVKQGYNKKETNVFTYLLESGSVWKQPIESGHFIVELKDDLQWEEVDGISGHFNFKQHPSERILFGRKVHFSPTPKDNLIITYFKNSADFNFEKVVTNENQLYAAIDVLSAKEIPSNLKFYEAQDPFKVNATVAGYFPMILTAALIYLPFIFIGIVVFLIVRYWYKKSKSKPINTYNRKKGF